MRGQYFLFTLFFLLSMRESFCADKDSNIIISESREYHEFIWQKAKNTVQVRQTIFDTYNCLYFPTTLFITKFYNDQTSVDDINVTIDHKKVENIAPRHAMYTKEGEFLSNSHVCFFNLPLGSKGSTGTVSFIETIRDPRYFTTIFFSGSYPVTHKEILIKVPRWMKIEIKEMNFKNFDITRTTWYDQQNDADLYTYTIKDLPAISSEPNCPGASYTQPHLLVLAKEADVYNKKITFINTIADQYAWYRQLIGSTTSNDSSIKAMAVQLTKGVRDDLGKIKSVFYWVQNNIRYLAYENGIAAFRPDKAEEVLRKKFGDCKGMANLTCELLKSIGYDSRLCWIGTNDIAYDYSTPSLAADNHMICALFWNGNHYFLDATQTYLPFNEYAERIQGRQVLVEDGDNYILTRIPTSTYRQNLDEEKRSMSIQGTGIEGTVSHVWKGEEKEMVLYTLSSIKKDISTEKFQQHLSNGNADCIITGFHFSDVTDFDQELTASYHVQLKNAVTSFGSDYYISLDINKEFSNFTFDPASRKQDYWFDNKMTMYREMELAIPEGYTLKSKLPNLEIKNDQYEFLITCSLLDGKIVYKKNILIKDIKLTRDRFAQWNADIRKLTALYNKQIVLTAK